MRFELVILDGSGKRFPLPVAGEVLIGSAAECAIRLTANDVSRRHALFTLRRGTVSLLDLGSKNGTFVAGQKVKEALVKAGALLRFSSVLAQLMPMGSTSDPAGKREGEAGEAKGRGQASPTGDVEAVDDGAGIGWLLTRWGRDGGSALAATLEWILQKAGARGAVVLRIDGAEQVVLAASGEVGSILTSTVVSTAVRHGGSRAKVVETVAIEDDAGSVLAVRCAEDCWLLLVVGDSNPAAGHVELFVRAVAVARRLDR